MKNTTFEPIPFGFTRTPLLPFIDNLENWEDLLEDDLVKKAIFFASPKLYEFLVEDFDQLSDALRQTFLKYYLRMSYRCTPFGLFSGVSTCQIDNKNTQILLTDIPRMNIRLDMHVLGLLYKKLEEKKEVREIIKYYPNDTIKLNNLDFKYIEQVFEDHEFKNYKLSKVDHLPILEKILVLSQNGVSFDEIIKLCISDGFDCEESTEFIHDLIDNNLLVSEFHFNVVGNEYHNVIRNLIEHIEKSHLSIENLDLYKEVLSDVKNIKLIINNETQHKLEKIFSKKINPQIIFQVDTFFQDLGSSINMEYFHEIENIYRFLEGISPKQKNELNEFIEEFSEKYDSQFIDLLEVMDPNNGMNFPLTKGLNLLPKDEIIYEVNNSKRLTPFISLTFNKEWNTFLSKKLKTQKEIKLTESEIQKFMFKGDINFPVLTTKSSILKDKAYIEFINHNNPSKFIARFSHIDEKIFNNIEKLVEIEESYYNKQNVILAEVAFTHNNLRVSNINQRRKLRRYTIPIIQPIEKDDSHILLSDIIVGVRNNKIILRSKKTNKRIIPRNSNAHLIQDGHLNIYNFLSKIETQDSNMSAVWTWGTHEKSEYLPRVSYKNIILAKEQWVIHLKNVKSFDLFKEYLLEKKVNDIVCFADGDREVPIRINHIASLKILWDELVKSKQLVIKECLFKQENLITNKNGKFTTNETLLFFKNKNPLPFQKEEDLEGYSDEIKRSFCLGEEWLFLKLYMVDSYADEKFLIQLTPLIEELYTKKIIQDWHFVRYIDTKFHIRIRFKGQGNFYEKVIQTFNIHFGSLFGKQIHRHIYDTYNRELERYYFQNIDLSERLFSIDSSAVIQLLSSLRSSNNLNLRWNLSFKLIDDLLNAFEFTLPYKKHLLFFLAENYKHEFNFTSKQNKKKLAQKFRSTKNDIYAVVDEQAYSKEISYILNRRYLELSHISDNIKANLNYNEINVFHVLSSYIHMLMNRWNSSNFRETEMVIYDLLSQFYKEKENRIKHLQY